MFASKHFKSAPYIALCVLTALSANAKDKDTIKRVKVAATVLQEVMGAPVGRLG